MSLRWEDSWHRNVPWNLAGEKILQDRGALPREEADIVRVYKAIHEENFLSIWLRKEVEGKEERREKVDKETREKVSRMRKREGEKGEDGTVAQPCFPLRLLIFSIREESESCGSSESDLWDDSCGLSECVP